MRLQKRDKEFIALAILLLLTGLTQDIGARSRPNHFHFLGVSASGGYSAILEDYPDLSTYGSWGADLHFGYEFQDNDHGFWASGMAGVQYLTSTAASSVHMQSYWIDDTQGKRAVMHYDITSPLREEVRLLYISIPLMAGWYSYKGFYFGLGVRLAINTTLGSRSSLEYTTSGEYGEYFDSFRDMPNHFYTSYTATNDTARYSGPFKVSVMGEIGYDVLASGRKARVKFDALKIAAFVDCGIHNIVDANGSGSICTVDPNNASRLIPRTYYNTYHTSDHRVIPLYAGVKITYLFLIKATKCPHCKRRNYVHRKNNNRF